MKCIDQTSKDPNSVTRKDARPTIGGNAYSPSLRALVNADGVPVKLRAQCVEVFEFLAKSPDTLIKKEEIVQAVWGEIAVTDDSLIQCISEIRKALGDSERSILKTQRG